MGDDVNNLWSEHHGEEKIVASDPNSPLANTVFLCDKK